MKTVEKSETGAAKRRAARERTIGVRVSDDEHAMLEERAWSLGKVVAEYARDILLNSLHGNILPQVAEGILAEVIALRLLLLNLLPALAKSELPGMEEIKEFVEEVDQEKLRILNERINQWNAGPGRNNHER